MSWKQVPFGIQVGYIAGAITAGGYVAFLIWLYATGQCFSCQGGILEILLPLPRALRILLGVLIPIAIFSAVSTAAFLLVLFSKVLLGRSVTDESLFVRYTLRTLLRRSTQERSAT